MTKFLPLIKDDRKNLVFLARTAETAERYEDMCKFMRALVHWTNSKTEKTDLTLEERNLLSVAFKNVVGVRRSAWRALNVDENKEDDLIKIYKKMVEGELETKCKDVIDLLNTLIKNCKEEGDSLVFYLKMTGDYYRYLAEIIKDQEYITNAQTAYQKAWDLAQKNLKPTNPIRLGLALNFSVFYFEIAKDTSKACELAKSAFDLAISKLDTLEENLYKDCSLIMQLLRDNLTLWNENKEQSDESNATSGQTTNPDN
jgi:14-3-3 protein epsilon